MLKITDIKQAVRNPNRVNISVDGKYRFSLDIAQVVDLGVKVGNEYAEAELVALETESSYGKLYARALEYCLVRPRSAREMRDYLHRKTRPTKRLIKAPPRQGATLNRGDKSEKFESRIIERPGVSQVVAERVFDRLVEKCYIDDEKFARWWVENRNQTKGTSLRKLSSELAAKGIDRSIIEATLAESDRSDDSELAKIIAKKRHKYPDEQKLMHYLARQGFGYDDITSALSRVD